MKRLFWLGLGVGAGAYLARRAQSAAQSLSPSGIGANVADGLRELGAGIGAFGAEVRAGMSERERELTAFVAHRTGEHVPTIAEALAEPPAVRRGARARGAGA